MLQAPEKVVGIVVGSRKCGTTWLYENFRHDPELTVSKTVKESGFFARPDDRDFEYYEGLFPNKPGKKVEVDASLALFRCITCRKSTITTLT